MSEDLHERILVATVVLSYRNLVAETFLETTQPARLGLYLDGMAQASTLFSEVKSVIRCGNGTGQMTLSTMLPRDHLKFLKQAKTGFLRKGHHTVAAVELVSAEVEHDPDNQRAHS